MAQCSIRFCQAEATVEIPYNLVSKKIHPDTPGGWVPVCEECSKRNAAGS